MHSLDILGSMEPDQDTIAEWIEQLRQGDEEASRQLWERFFDRLLDVAARKIKHARTADYDEEDVVLSALKSFCLGVREGRFPRLLDRDDLWRLLFVITSRKIADRFAFLRRAKRDVAREATHPSAHSSWDTGSAWFISGEPNPAVAAECEEQLSILIERLQHEDLKRVAIWKMEGYTNEEIATLMSRSLATIERKLRTIRDIWSQS